MRLSQSNCTTPASESGDTSRPVAEWFYIKVRKRGTKPYWFLSSGGRMNRLRIHAATFNSQGDAETHLALIEAGNPEYEGKVVHA